MKNLSIYCTSRFGVLGLTVSIKKELGKFGVEATYLCPGYVKTSFFENSPDDFTCRRTQEQRKMCPRK